MTRAESVRVSMRMTEIEIERRIKCAALDPVLPEFLDEPLLCDGSQAHYLPGLLAPGAVREYAGAAISGVIGDGLLHEPVETPHPAGSAAEWRSTAAGYGR